jgi:hypothetical protein
LGSNDKAGKGQTQIVKKHYFTVKTPIMDETPKSNAVQCRECGTVNPLFYISCTNCKRKLDLTDKRLFEQKIEDNKTVPTSNASLLSLVLFGVLFSIFFYFALNIMGFGRNEEKSALGNNDSYSAKSLTKSAFIVKVKENQNIIDADITDVNFLYISVVDDGVSKDAMAVYYCRLAKEYNMGVDAVKVVDASTANLLKNGTAYGRELAKSFCDD